MEKLDEIHKQEEIYWRKKSRLQWLKEGDENMNLFQTMANGRKNWNLIPSIRHKNVAFTNSREIGQIVTMHFRRQFGLKRASRFRVNFQKLLEHK